MPDRRAYSEGVDGEDSWAAAVDENVTSFVAKKRAETTIREHEQFFLSNS